MEAINLDANTIKSSLHSRIAVLSLLLAVLAAYQCDDHQFSATNRNETNGITSLGITIKIMIINIIEEKQENTKLGHNRVFNIHKFSMRSKWQNKNGGRM